MSYTISELAKQSGLSRSTLLYYERIGLMQPAARGMSGYRTYSEDDAERLRQICIYRNAGVPLSDIAGLLRSADRNSAHAVLLAHLAELGRQINELCRQQGTILTLLGGKELPEQPAQMTVKTMTTLLHSAGLNDDDLDRLHASFEANDPGGHQCFLEALGLPTEAVASVREAARKQLART